MMSTGQADLEVRGRGVEEQQAAEDERDGSADPQDAVALDLDLGYEQDHGQHDQGDPHEVHRQHREPVEAQEQRDDSRDPPDSQTWRGDLKNDAEHP